MGRPTNAQWALQLFLSGCQVIIYLCRETDCRMAIGREGRSCYVAAVAIWMLPPRLPVRHQPGCFDPYQAAITAAVSTAAPTAPPTAAPAILPAALLVPPVLLVLVLAESAAVERAPAPKVRCWCPCCAALHARGHTSTQSAGYQANRLNIYPTDCKEFMEAAVLILQDAKVREAVRGEGQARTSKVRTAGERSAWRPPEEVAEVRPGKPPTPAADVLLRVKSYVAGLSNAGLALMPAGGARPCLLECTVPCSLSFRGFNPDRRFPGALNCCSRTCTRFEYV